MTGGFALDLGFYRGFGKVRENESHNSMSKPLHVTSWDDGVYAAWLAHIMREGYLLNPLSLKAGKSTAAAKWDACMKLCLSIWNGMFNCSVPFYHCLQYRPCMQVEDLSKRQQQYQQLGAGYLV